MNNNKSLQTLFDDYLQECDYVAKLRPETTRGYRNVFDLLLRIMPETTIDTLSPQIVMTFLKRLEKRERLVGKIVKNTGIKQSTAATYRSKLNNFFEWLVKRGHISKNPFDDMPYVSPTYTDLRWLSRDQVEKIIAAVVTADYKNTFLLKRNLLIIYILLFCGLRRGELLGLQLRDIDFKLKRLTVRPETSKSNKMRFLPINSKVCVHLKSYLEERGKRKLSNQFLLVSDNRDHKFTADGLKHLFVGLERRSGLDFHPHCFRHTFAINFYNQNKDIVQLKELMGHADLSMTLQYLRCQPIKGVSRSVEAMEIDNLL